MNNRLPDLHLHNLTHTTEGQALSGLIEHQRRALETTTIAAKLDELLANPGIRRMMEKV